jgi:hypothetical protein
MALLEYATVTVPSVVKKDVIAFFDRNPILKRMRQKNKVIRSGGTHVRVIRVKSGHSDVVQIDGSNMSVPLNKKETLSPMTGDWAKYIKPIILPRYDQDRLQTKEEKKRYVLAQTKAATQSLENDFTRQMVVGNISALRGFGSFNGQAFTTGTSSGFTHGALKFRTPAQQESDGTSYLNETRKFDEVNLTDHWHNQFSAHAGIGTDFLATAEEIKLLADTYAEDEEGISIGILSNDDLVLLGDEIRAYPGGAGGTGLMYTPADLEAGKAHKTIYMANGVQYFPNKWMNATDVGKTQAAYLLNPNQVEWWVNANHDFQTTKFTYHLDYGNQDADVGFIICEVQLAIPNLMVHGCLSQ